MPRFLETEKSIIRLFKKESNFTFQNSTYIIEKVAKANATKGDPKTDVYISAINKDTEEKEEFKISIKQSDADFLENKITAPRALQIFGDDWKNIIINSIESISSNFENQEMIYKKDNDLQKIQDTLKEGKKVKLKKEKGMFKLGWRLDIINKPTGNFTVKLSKNLLEEVLAGKKLSKEKRNAIIDGQIIPDSGIANYLITVNTDEGFNDIQEIIDNLKSINEYIENNGDIYLTFRSINLRTMPINQDTGNVENKIKMESRHFAVYPEWQISNSKLDYKLCFNNPLGKTSSMIKKDLLDTLKKLKIKNVDDLSSSNVNNYSNIVYE